MATSQTPSPPCGTQSGYTRQPPDNVRCTVHGTTLRDYSMQLDQLSFSSKVKPHAHFFSYQKYQFSADDLEDLDHLGCGTYGTTSKMFHPLTQTTMAVKVSQQVVMVMTVLDRFGSNKIRIG